MNKLRYFLWTDHIDNNRINDVFYYIKPISDCSRSSMINMFNMIPCMIFLSSRKPSSIT